jgi:endonuclease YncB( thermonuclease family)
MKRFPLLLLLLCLASCRPPGTPQAFAGEVVGVHDGDTLTVMNGSRQVKVRLYGVDAPESNQAFGSVSKRFLSTLVFGKTVRVSVQTTDRYGRSVSRVGVEGADVSLQIIRAGLGWYYKQYSKDASYAAAEAEARVAQRGLWADSSPTAPWAFRQLRGQAAAPPNAPDPATSGNATGSAPGPFRGNSVSHVFHAAGCQYFDCANCTANLPTYQAAIAAGFTPHRDCIGR